MYTDPETGVTISGITSFVAEMPQQASDSYASSMYNLVEALCWESGRTGNAKCFQLDFDDNIVSSATIIRGRKLVWEPNEERLRAKKAAAKIAASTSDPKQPHTSSTPVPTPESATATATVPATMPATVPAAAGSGEKKNESTPDNPSPLNEPLLDISKERGESDEKKPAATADTNAFTSRFLILAMMILAIGLAYSANYSFMLNFLSFILALIIGYIVVWGVDPLLHASLMSETNAISGIIAIGAMLQLYGYDGSLTLPNICGFIALFFAFINVFGGFRLTDKMLGLLNLG